jgi:hypothetical protein
MKYRKKPVVIDAIQYLQHNFNDCAEFLGADFIGIKQERYCPVKIRIKTLEGEHIADEGDYLIRGVKGEHYACKPDIFEMTYEAA